MVTLSTSVSPGQPSVGAGCCVKSGEVPPMAQHAERERMSFAAWVVFFAQESS